MTKPNPRWSVSDIAVLAYTSWTGLLVAVRHDFVTGPWSILGFHALVLLVVLLLPPRGAHWEHQPLRTGWNQSLRGTARFLRYTYPLLLIVFFFEEVENIVHAVRPEVPYWFEPYLYAADRRLFGELPARLMASWTGLVQDEIFHAFYFSYYFIVIGGTVLAYMGPKGSRERHPSPRFETAFNSMILAYLLSFLWYPWLPARGPWENPELIADLPAFRGVVFPPLVEWIIAQGAQSGGCFPSSHVAGSWGIVLGLAGFQRRWAVVLGMVTVGLSFSCVYTRYHHGADVPAGVAMGLLGAWLGWKLSG